jgi:hypothetical protein
MFFVSVTILMEQNDPRTAKVVRATAQIFPSKVFNFRATAKVELDRAGLNIRAELIATLTSPFVAPNEAGPGAWAFIRSMLKLK